MVGGIGGGGGEWGGGRDWHGGTTVNRAGIVSV